MPVIAIHRDPFSVAPRVYHLPEGETLAQMAGRVTTLPPGWPRHEGDVICINGHVVDRAAWPLIVPKVMASRGPVEVSFHAPPMGGGEGGRKNILGLVASIALVAVTSGIAGGTLLGGVSSRLATGLGLKVATARQLLAGGVALIGSSLASSLAPTPSRSSGPDTGANQRTRAASAQGNILEPNAALPRVVGTMRVFPPFVTEPFVYFDGEDEVVEVVAALSGPHQMTDIRIGQAAVADVGGIEVETREGWSGREDLTLVTRYARTTEDRSELRGHAVKEQDGAALDEAIDREDAVPQPKIVGTRQAPDEIWINLSFPQGLFINGQESTRLRVPFRLRMRRRGTSTWLALPELHYASAKVGERRAVIKLVWRDAAPLVARMAAAGWVEARLSTPGQTSPATTGWAANAQFDADTGAPEYVTNVNQGSNDVINVRATESVCTLYLDPAVFEPGQYEIEIKRGYAMVDSQYSPAAYTLASAVRDFFFYEGTGRIHQSRQALSDQVFVVRTSSVYNRQPVARGDVAVIAVKARNVALDSLSCLASGFVKDWDGSAWATWTTTSNPAPHMRDVLSGRLNADPVPAAILDDAGLVAWRTACAAEGYEVNAVLQDTSVEEAARVIAGAGYARLYQSDVWGVVRDYDRSAESPVQYFGDHNMAGFRWSKAFSRMPDGFRVSFFDAAADYEDRQIIHPDGATLTQQESYLGLVTEAEVRRRAAYDLAEAQHRTTFYAFEAPAEAIKCRRGSLIGVNADVLAASVGSGRVADIEFDGSGLVAAIMLDNGVPELTAAGWADIADLSAVEDMSLIGLRAGVVLRRAGGTASVHAVTTASEGGRLVFATPFAAAGLALDDLAIVGPVGREVLRLIVAEMSARDDLTWTITAVDEAPEIWT